MRGRRHFLRQLGLTAGAFSLPGIFEPLLASGGMEKLRRVNQLSPEAAASDEEFWAWVSSQYTKSPGITDLNNAGVNPQPLPVQEAHINYYKYCNDTPSFSMWRELDKGREPLRKRLARLAGVSPDEVAINRNSTEGLNTIIFGLKLKAGDEVIVAKQDYPAMLNAWKQREKREGIKLVWVNLDLPSEDEDALAKKYTSLFTSKTKAVYVTHMINWIGQILPVRKIADEAHKRNIEVICDSAQTFAHIDFKIPDLGCDYWATSLHKWLGAPFGTGMMWIRKEKISNVWALLSSNEPDGNDIRKFESLGTRSMDAEMAIAAAIDFYELIGAKRKEERLRYLKNYWTGAVSSLKGVTINTPAQPAHSCGIASISIDGMTCTDIGQKLLQEYRIHAVAMNWENIHGLRISPNVYTTTEELDVLVEALTKFAGEATSK